MKRKLSAFVMTLVLVVIVLIFHFFLKDAYSPLSPNTQPQDPSPTDISVWESGLPRNSVFVPYWGMEQSIDNTFDRYYYFGISGTENGIDRDESGYKNLSLFAEEVPSGKEKYLVVRMIDSGVNSKVLRDGSAQRKIIEDVLSAAREYEFDGIVLDFEMSALAFESVIKEINGFFGLFANSAKENNTPFLITIYGDTFYRLRPYDVKTIAKDADGVLIMAYDFHKANGNPGPNFPFRGQAIYGYDIKAMINDFTKVVPKEKISVVFGLFGYDWTIDNTNKGIDTAKPLTLNQITEKYLRNCKEKSCIIKRDNVSSETSVTYIDSEERNHVIWFEDLVSLEEKKKYLKDQGINSTALWAYSYF